MVEVGDEASQLDGAESMHFAQEDDGNEIIIVHLNVRDDQDARFVRGPARPERRYELLIQSILGGAPSISLWYFFAQRVLIERRGGAGSAGRCGRRHCILDGDKELRNASADHEGWIPRCGRCVRLMMLLSAPGWVDEVDRIEASLTLDGDGADCDCGGGTKWGGSLGLRKEEGVVVANCVVQPAGAVQSCGGLSQRQNLPLSSKSLFGLQGLDWRSGRRLVAPWTPTLTDGRLVVKWQSCEERENWSNPSLPG